MRLRNLPRGLLSAAADSNHCSVRSVGIHSSPRWSVAPTTPPQTFLLGMPNYLKGSHPTEVSTKRMYCTDSAGIRHQSNPEEDELESATHLAAFLATEKWMSGMSGLIESLEDEEVQRLQVLEDRIRVEEEAKAEAELKMHRQQIATNPALSTSSSSSGGRRRDINTSLSSRSAASTQSLSSSIAPPPTAEHHSASSPVDLYVASTEEGDAKVVKQLDALLDLMNDGTQFSPSFLSLEELLLCLDLITTAVTTHVKDYSKREGLFTEDLKKTIAATCFGHLPSTSDSQRITLLVSLMTLGVHTDDLLIQQLVPSTACYAVNPLSARQKVEVIQALSDAKTRDLLTGGGGGGGGSLTASGVDDMPDLHMLLTSLTKGGGELSQGKMLSVIRALYHMRYTKTFDVGRSFSRQLSFDRLSTKNCITLMRASLTMEGFSDALCTRSLEKLSSSGGRGGGGMIAGMDARDVGHLVQCLLVMKGDAKGAGMSTANTSSGTMATWQGKDRFVACRPHITRLLPKLVRRIEQLQGRFGIKDARRIMECFLLYEVTNGVVFSMLCKSGAQDL